MTSHGYNAYSKGCRCPVCRQAKATYMRDRRTVGRNIAIDHQQTLGHRVRTLLMHPRGLGCASQYDERGCRCYECVQAKTIKRLNERDRQQQRQQVAA